MKKKILAPAVWLPVVFAFASLAALGQTADQYFDQAVVQIRAKNWKEAERLLGECIRVAPRDVECIYRRGLVRQLYIGYGLALDDYNLALSVTPDNVEILTQRGGLYGSLKRPDDAITDLTRAVQLKPAHARAYYERANIYREKGDADKAIVDYTQAVKFNPKDELSFAFRGSLYEKKNMPDLAVADYTSAIAADPADGSNYYDRGKVYWNQKKKELAEADFKRAIELDPTLKTRVDSLYTLARLDETLKKFDPAKMDTTPKTPVQQAHSDGYKQMDAKQWDAAVASFTKAIELAPKDHWGYVYRSRAYTGKGDYAKALIDLNAGTAMLTPERAVDYIHERAEIYYLQARYPLALAELGKAIAAKKDGQPNEYNLLLRGKIYAKQGKTALARADFEKAMQMSQYLKPKAQAELAKLPAN